MRTIITILCVLTIMSCNQLSGKSESQKALDDLIIANKADSMVRSHLKNALLDTTGVYTSPIKVLKASLYKESYSNYKSASLTFKNISDKKIEAVRFRWYGEDSFGEPADMGGINDGFGGGFDDDPLKPGQSRTSSWNIMSSRGKKILLAWPTEIAFSDGTKWELGK